MNSEGYIYIFIHICIYVAMIIKEEFTINLRKSGGTQEELERIKGRGK